MLPPLSSWTRTAHGYTLDRPTGRAVLRLHITRIGQAWIACITFDDLTPAGHPRRYDSAEAARDALEQALKARAA